MRNTISISAVVALLVAVPSQAATDMGLTLQNAPLSTSRSSGIGAQAAVTIRLGDRRTARASEKVTLGVQAGPVTLLQNRSTIGGQRRIMGNALSFSLKPSYATTLAIAGQPVATTLTRLGAAENEDDEKSEKKQGTGDKVAWVAVVAGGVMAGLVAAFAIHCGGGACSE